MTPSAKLAGLEGVTLHPLRHSAVSLMLVGAVPLKVVSEILGHSSASITGDIYGHVEPDVAANAKAYLSSVLANGGLNGGQTPLSSSEAAPG